MAPLKLRVKDINQIGSSLPTHEVNIDLGFENELKQIHEDFLYEKQPQ